jgi:hypothetical protein
MPLLSRKRTILAKIETVYGTDPTPTGAANAVLCRNINPKPQNADLKSRELIRPYLGASERYLAGAYSTIEFEVEMAGSGTAGTAPAYGALLRACGMTETVSAGISVTYTPLSATFPSVTIYFNVDGVLHKITGARGNVELMLQAGEIPYYKFTFTGLYNAPADTAAPAVTYTGYKEPLVVNSDNSSLFSFFSYSGAMQSLNLNYGNEVNYRMLVGAEDVQLIGRSVGGTVVIEAPTITLKDYFTAGLNTALGTLDITHGTTAGNKVQISSTRANLANPDYVDQDGIQMLSCPIELVPSTAGNDEISIIVK